MVDWDTVERYRGARLPHYEIPGAVYFVTFRLRDSLPAETSASLLAARAAFLRHHPPPHTEEQAAVFKRLYSVPLECHLDRGHGQCVLRQAGLRGCVEQTLLRFDGLRYQLADYVIMPNHMHLLMRVRRGLSMRMQCRDWKAVAAREINRRLGRHGRLWQPEPFDHIVRNAQKLQQCRRYIQENPRNLPKTDFTLSQGRGFSEVET